jgi:hypothetical protein
VAATFARFVALFVVVVWAWMLYTAYANRFDTDDIIFRLAKSGAMLAIAAVAVNVPEVMAGRGGAVGFAIGYVVLRSLLIALYLRVSPRRAGPRAQAVRGVYRWLRRDHRRMAAVDLCAEAVSLRSLGCGDGGGRGNSDTRLGDAQGARRHWQVESAPLRSRWRRRTERRGAVAPTA